jgi:APA family basic amino acid/polyamine antiporter
LNDLSHDLHREQIDIPSPASSGIGVTTGALLIVANMIGVGVFTTTGYMVAALHSPTAILVAWMIGGIAAFCGALAYAELGSALPRNGGEYQLLSRIFHPALGFVAGWVSLIVGFAAPLAAFSAKFGEYLTALGSGVNPKVSGLVLIGALAVLHSVHVATGSRTHNVFSIGKIVLIVAFILAGLVWGDMSRLAEGTQPWGDVVRSPLFAIQLVYVSFSYSGWNTAAYLAGEFRNPTRDVPRAIVAGTALVAVLYLGLNVVFLASAPMDVLADKANVGEVGHVAAVGLFGPRAGKLMTLLIALGLISAASANSMAGPRVYEAMGFDYPILKSLTHRRAGGGPVVAILLQSVLAAAMLLTASFEALLSYIGLTLSLVAALTVAGVIVLRWREPDLPRPYRTWGYPLSPLIFLALEGWMVYFLVQRDVAAVSEGVAQEIGVLKLFGLVCRQPAVVSVATLAVGFVLYSLVRPKKNDAPPHSPP